MNKKYDISVVIGRFSPAHFAHIELFTKALDIADNLIIVLGSYKSPRSFKNPFTADERAEMIKNSLPLELQSRVHFGYVIDTIYDDPDWVVSVSSTVKNIAYRLGYGNDYPPKVALVTHKKDDSTYYIDYFKSWKIVDVGGITATGTNVGPALSATKVRELYFERYFTLLPAICPNGVVEFLLNFANTETYTEIKKEYDDAIAYEQMYENVPYGQIHFVTVDNIVIQSGHILLIKRKESPGKGLWALPGGHLNVNEKFLTGALRELYEETSIKIPEKVLRGSIFYDEIFDNPDRSLRCRVKTKKGRTITRAFGYKLDDAAELPHVKAADDAGEAWWFTYAEVQEMRESMFEDHYDICMKALNKL